MIDLCLLAGIIALLLQGLDVLLTFISAGREVIENDNGAGYALEDPVEI